jgi:hypothetical protein
MQRILLLAVFWACGPAKPRYEQPPEPSDWCAALDDQVCGICQQVTPLCTRLKARQDPDNGTCKLQSQTFMSGANNLGQEPEYHANLERHCNPDGWRTWNLPQ